MYSSMLIKTDLERNIHVAIMRNLQELIVIFFFFFLREEKGDLRVAVIVHAPRYSWVSSRVPPAQTGARKLRTHTHPRLYWFLRLPEIVITVLVRTRTWDVVKASAVTYHCGLTTDDIFFCLI